jgi:hypothetical protein
MKINIIKATIIIVLGLVASNQIQAQYVESIIRVYRISADTNSDVVSFRNSTNEEMAILQDGVLTQKKGSKLHSDRKLSLLGSSISFKNNDNSIGIGAHLENGTLTLDQIRLNVTTFPDYVFAKDYELMPLEEVDTYIQKYKQLLNMPSKA